MCYDAIVPTVMRLDGPRVAIYPNDHPPAHVHVIGAVVALGVVCTGVEYLLYFRMITDLDPAPGRIVLFLVQVFGVLVGLAFPVAARGWSPVAR